LNNDKSLDQASKASFIGANESYNVEQVKENYSSERANKRGVHRANKKLIELKT
jgi:hypothetical protein